ncbi:MAG: YjbQ family protein, partial [Bacteroidia bacterium]|nr:YjbQ family protein [Bacteroidia bacterium]MDW8133726.1 YjbQ family protein [Bacteroidia bacterium]
MQSHTAYIWIHTPEKRGIVHLTPQIRAEVKKSGIQEGLCLVSSMHLTASVIVQDNEKGLFEDIFAWLE